MRRLTRILISLVSLVIAFIVFIVVMSGLSFLEFMTPQALFQGLLDIAREDLRLGVLFISAWLLIILFIARYLEALFLRFQEKRTISFDAPTGKIGITLFAIEDMVKKMLEEGKNISRVRPRALPIKRGIELIVKGNLASEVNLFEFSQEIQEMVKKKLEQLLGEDKEIKVVVEIGKVVFPSRRKGEKEKDREREEKKEEPEVPFRNYRYE